jgi:hypothetical protein
MTPDLFYTSRKKLFAGKTGRSEPSVENPIKDDDNAAADKRGETESPIISQLSDELSRVNFKSAEAQYKAT